MRIVFWISWRYLWGRRKERFVSLISVISILGVAIGVWALIVVLSVMSGFDKEFKERIIGNFSHITVDSPAPIIGYDQMLKDIKGIEHVLAAAPYVEGQAVLQSERVVRGAIVRGVDLAFESQVTRIDKYLVAGEKDLTGGIFLSKELAYLIGVNIGEELTMINPKGKKFPLVVKALFTSGAYDFDLTVVFIGLDKAQEIFGFTDASSGISVKIEEIFLADSVKKDIQKSIGPHFFVRTWSERNKNFFAALKLEKIMMFLFLALIVFVAAFNIIGTLVVMVTEKTKDIGILKAIGMSKGRIRAIFTLEGLLIGSLGIALGFTLGIFTCLLLDKYKFIKLSPDVYYSLESLPVSIELWPDIAMILIVAFLISLLSTIYPAIKAANLKPVNALRYE